MIHRKTIGKGLSRASLKRKKKRNKKLTQPILKNKEEKNIDERNAESDIPSTSSAQNNNDNTNTSVNQRNNSKGNVTDLKKMKNVMNNKRMKKSPQVTISGKKKVRDISSTVEKKECSFELNIVKREKIAKVYERVIGREIKTPSGLKFCDIEIGCGKLPSVRQNAVIRYKGYLGKDGNIFSKGIINIKFGKGEIIQGWEEGLSTMRPGGKRELLIPPHLAYGDTHNDKIPPNSTLFFHIELIRIGARKQDVLKEDEIPLPSSFLQKNKIRKRKY